MASVYPGALDTLATAKADATFTATDHPQHHNDLADAVNKIEAALGVNPQGGFSDLVTRLQSRDLKDSCRAASAGTNVTLTAPGATMDGVTLAVGDRVFLKDQTAPADNGIYVFNGSAATLTRATDANTAGKMTDSTIVTVEQGTLNADTMWELVTDNPITLGTTALRYTRLTPAYQEPQVSGPAGAGIKPSTGKMMSMTPLGGLAGTTIQSSGILGLNVLGTLRAGHTLSNLTYFAAATAGATLTHSWACLVRVSDLTIVAVSPDNTTASWAVQTSRTYTFNTPFTADKDEFLYAGIMIAGTTMPTLYGNTLTNAITWFANLGGNSTGSLTTPLAVGATVAAPTSRNTIFYIVAG